MALMIFLLGNYSYIKWYQLIDIAIIHLYILMKFDTVVTNITDQHIAYFYLV